jgi:hypothetical protein
MVPALTAPVMPSCRASSFLKYSSATSHARNGGFSSTGGGWSGLLAPIGEGIFGTKDERRDGPPRGEAGGSPRREDVDDFLTSAGEDARLILIVLELLRRELDAILGDDGARWSSEGLRGEFIPGDCGSGVFVAAWSDSRLCGCERRFASLFVCLALLGVPALAAGAYCCW